jgi:hypothetical protein
MSCEHLVCAACAGPVADGRCPVCRAGRQQVHHTHSSVQPAALVAVLAALVLLWLVLQTYTA